MSKFHLETAQKTDNSTKYIVEAIDAVDSTCIVLLGIYFGVSLPKIIKFG